jgi:hypothetical protein
MRARIIAETTRAFIGCAPCKRSARVHDPRQRHGTFGDVAARACVTVAPYDASTLHREELDMAGKSVKNKRKYKALKRKGMSKTRAAKIANAGKKGSRKGGRKSGRRRKHG